MGTPPASGSLDQMRRMQISARGGGECALSSVLGRKTSDPVASGTASVARAIAGMALTFCWSRLVFANGGVAGPVRSDDVSQQVLFAQHPRVHAFSLRVVDSIHVTAGNWRVAAMRASPKIDDVMVLIRIALISYLHQNPKSSRELGISAEALGDLPSTRMIEARRAPSIVHAAKALRARRKRLEGPAEDERKLVPPKDEKRRLTEDSDIRMGESSDVRQHRR